MVVKAAGMLEGEEAVEEKAEEDDDDEGDEDDGTKVGEHERARLRGGVRQQHAILHSSTPFPRKRDKRRPRREARRRARARARGGGRVPRPRRR